MTTDTSKLWDDEPAEYTAKRQAAAALLFDPGAAPQKKAASAPLWDDAPQTKAVTQHVKETIEPAAPPRTISGRFQEVIA